MKNKSYICDKYKLPTQFSFYQNSSQEAGKLHLHSLEILHVISKNNEDLLLLQVDEFNVAYLS